MTRLATIFENSQRLALTAAEEAQRFGRLKVDVEHVFLALIVSQTDAGRVLRARGVTLDQARRAVQAEHAHRTAALGVGDVQVPPRPIPAAGPGDIDWNERTLSLFSRSGGDGTGTTLLRALIDDPGELVSAVLGRLGIDPHTVIATAEAAGTPNRHGDSSVSSPGPEGVSYDAFIPALRGRVWELIDSSERRPEWDTAVGSIEPAGPHRWIGRASAESRTRWRVPRRARTRSITLIDREESNLVEWEITFPRTRTSRSERLRVELTDQPGGTGIRLTLRPVGTRRWGPLTRFLATGELTRIASGISRTFRV